MPNCSSCTGPASLIGKRARGVVEIGRQDPTSGVSPRRKRASAKPRQAAPKPTASHVQAYSIQGAYKGHTGGIQGVSQLLGRQLRSSSRRQARSEERRVGK